MKYLGLYLIGGADFKIDLTAAKWKYYGCFNTIIHVVGNQVNEIMALHFVIILPATAYVWMWNLAIELNKYTWNWYYIE